MVSAGGALVKWDVDLVCGHTYFVQAALCARTRPLARAQIDDQHVRVGSAGENLKPARGELGGEPVGVGAHSALVVGERLRGGDLETGRLGRDRVEQWPPLEDGEDSLVERAGMLCPAEDEAAAGPGEGLVRGRADEVAERDRIGVQ